MTSMRILATAVSAGVLALYLSAGIGILEWFERLMKHRKERTMRKSDERLTMIRNPTGPEIRFFGCVGPETAYMMLVQLTRRLARQLRGKAIRSAVELGLQMADEDRARENKGVAQS